MTKKKRKKKRNVALPSSLRAREQDMKRAAADIKEKIKINVPICISSRQKKKKRRDSSVEIKWRSFTPLLCSVSAQLGWAGKNERKRSYDNKG